MKPLIQILMVLTSLLAAIPAQAQSGGDYLSINDQAIDNYNKGNDDEAIRLGLQALSLAEAKYGANHSEVATLCNNMGLFNKSKANYPVAETYFKRAMQIDETTLGKDHATTSRDYQNLGDLYRVMKRYADAQTNLTRAMQIREAKMPNTAKLADTYNSLGYTYEALEKYVDAEGMYNKALTIREVVLGPDHVDVGYNLNDIGLVNYYQRKYSHDEIVAYARGFEGRSLTVILNAADQEQTIDVGLNSGARILFGDARVTDEGISVAARSGVVAEG